MSVYPEGLRCEKAIRRFSCVFVLGTLAIRKLVQIEY